MEYGERGWMNWPRITELFLEVKRTYFPRWDREGNWSAVLGNPELCRDSTGYCDSKRQMIFLHDQVLDMPDDGLRALLIHEIGHDVAAAGHNLTWARRMEVAAKKADRLEEHEVAVVVRSFIFCDTPTLYKEITGLDHLPGERGNVNNSAPHN